MFKLYARSQQAQLDWIRAHPVKWIAYNAIATGVFIGYIEWKDRREMRKLGIAVDQKV